MGTAPRAFDGPKNGVRFRARFQEQEVETHCQASTLWSNFRGRKMAPNFAPRFWRARRDVGARVASARSTRRSLLFPQSPQHCWGCGSSCALHFCSPFLPTGVPGRRSCKCALKVGGLRRCRRTPFVVKELCFKCFCRKRGPVMLLGCSACRLNAFLVA